MAFVMTLITTTSDLADFCSRARRETYVTVDTEFMREKTYWPQLCLVQVATSEEAVAIDPLAEEIDLAPLLELLADEKVLKVFHASRQDVEIFVAMTGKVPTPLFDTQVAAMVCGYGDSVGYETLVNKIARQSLDKSSRFTDWSQRPLTEKQVDYALADVTHLRVIYEAMAAQIAETGRESWIAEEMEVLTTPSTYQVDPWEAWQRIKHRSGKPRFLAILREVAAWRERAVQQRDIPRNRLLRDDSLLDIAGQAPTSLKDLGRIRALPRNIAEGKLGEELIAAIQRAMALPKDELPLPPDRTELPAGIGPMVELLKVLLKTRCEEAGVAPRLVASGNDLELIAAFDKPGVPALHGWRLELFGHDALDLKGGKLGLGIRDGAVEVFELEE